MTNEQIVLEIQAGHSTESNLMLLFEQNKKLIQQIANKYRYLAEMEDLMQESYIALQTAAQEWNENTGCNFSTFFFTVCKNRLTGYCHNTASAIRIPQEMRSLMNQYLKFEQAYYKEHGTRPAKKEILHALQITEHQLTNLEQYIYRDQVKSLDETMTDPDGGEVPLSDFVKDPTDVIETAENKIFNQQLAERLLEAINKLKQFQQVVIYSYYFENQTLESIAKEENVTQKVVVRQRKNALRELRRNHKLKAFLPEIYSDALKGNSIHRFNESWTSSTERTALKLIERSTENEYRRKEN